MGVGVTQRAQAGRRGLGEGIAAEEVYVVVLKRGEPGEQLDGDGEAVGGELLDGGVEVSGWSRRVLDRTSEPAVWMPRTEWA